jgi:hypothetical protein
MSDSVTVVKEAEWDPETMGEHPYDVEKTLRLFEEANRQ